jgi:hypothetical protein
MFTFTHVTRFDSGKVDAAGKAIQAAVSEELTVPTTLDDLAELLDKAEESDTSEIMVGNLPDGKERRITVPTLCADYIRGRKLRSNQEMQAAQRGGGVMAHRAKIMAWFSNSNGEVSRGEAFARMMAASESPAAMKAHNAFLDKLYTDNKEAIDNYKK